MKCVSCGQATSGETARFWDGRCWRCEMRWLRTHKRIDLVRGRPTVATLQPWDTYKCIFVHIPKTAGMSIAAALFGEGGSTHAPLSSLEGLLSETEFNTYFKFTFVRNPWDRLVSAYEYLRVGVGDDEYDKAMSTKVAGLGTFERFVDWLRDTEASEGMHFLPQHKHVNTSSAENAMDYIGYFETLEQDVSRVAKRLGVSAKLPHINKSPSRGGYRDYFDSYTADVVGKVYRRDLEMFGYDFENDHLEANRLRYSNGD